MGGSLSELHFDVVANHCYLVRCSEHALGGSLVKFLPCLSILVLQSWLFYIYGQNWEYALCASVLVGIEVGVLGIEVAAAFGVGFVQGACLVVLPVCLRHQYAEGITRERRVACHAVCLQGIAREGHLIQRRQALHGCLLQQPLALCQHVVHRLGRHCNAYGAVEVFVPDIVLAVVEYHLP